MQTIESRLKSEFYANPSVKVELEKQLQALDENQTTPFAAAEKLLSLKRWKVEISNDGCYILKT